MASLAPAPSPETPASPAPFQRRLRVGVFADGPLQPRWLVEAVAKVASSDFAQIVWGQTLNEKGNEKGVRSLFDPKRDLTPFPSREGLSPVWCAYRALDRKLFGSGDWSKPVALSKVVALSPDSACEPVDVVIALGDVPDEAIAAHAAHGVWRYCFGSDHGICEADAGVAEVLEGADVTGSGLRVHLGADRGNRLVYQSWSRTQPFSVARSRDNLFAKTTEFLARALRDLHRGGPAWLDRASRKLVPGTRFPKLMPGTDYSISMAKRVAQRAIEKVAVVEQWSLAFRFVDIEPWTGSLAGFHRLAPPHDGFWADPFPIQRNGKSYVFFEELPAAKGRAHISVMEVDREGRASKPERVLERDYHLSYPFLVEDGGQLYMVPETAENRTVEIYRCIDFPRRWRRERVLLDNLVAADATLHQANGRWWMFANVAANGAEIHDELHVFTSDKLLGDWQPLAGNPVKSDVRGARPAGRLFTQGGKLYRPSQICAPLYGAGVALQRVTRLDDEFEEQEERRIVPAQGEGVLGLHTINRAGDLSVTDAFVRRPRLRLAG
ncbi:MAG TPA: hypothetical protein VM051_01105 [Usitatibacter sp.]|nr:hypothetical protein [Usitatibacter sp.]